jgi:hypothetical protein
MRFGRSLPRLSSRVEKPVIPITVYREALFPDSIVVETGLTGAVTVIDEDPDNPDANWITSTAATTATELRVTFTDPTGPPVPGAQLQEFRIRLRPSA